MAKLKPYARTKATDDPAADFCEQLTRDTFTSAFLGGNVIDVEHDGSSVTVDVAHGLQRAYKGAIQIGASSAATAVVCLLPEEAADAGVDTTRFIRFTQGAATAMTSRWRAL